MRIFLTFVGNAVMFHFDNKETMNGKSRLTELNAETATTADLNEDSVNTMAEALGMEYTAVAHGRMEATMPVDRRTRQQFGILSGGATVAMAETLAGVGSVLACPPGRRVVGAQVSANHISSALDGDTVRGVATMIHEGRTSHVWNVDVFSSAGKLVSAVRVVNFILKVE